jgi:hypothetical protein
MLFSRPFYSTAVYGGANSLILSVHDELMGEVATDAAPSEMAKLRTAMEC